MILKNDVDVPVFDKTSILVKEAVEYALKEQYYTKLSF